MIIDDFDTIGIIIFPYKTQTVLIIIIIKLLWRNPFNVKR